MFGCGCDVRHYLAWPIWKRRRASWLAFWRLFALLSPWAFQYAQHNFRNFPLAHSNPLGLESWVASRFWCFFHKGAWAHLFAHACGEVGFSCVNGWVFFARVQASWTATFSLADQCFTFSFCGTSTVHICEKIAENDRHLWDSGVCKLESIHVKKFQQFIHSPSPHRIPIIADIGADSAAPKSWSWCVEGGKPKNVTKCSYNLDRKRE